jgi:hypothetical protein
MIVNVTQSNIRSIILEETEIWATTDCGWQMEMKVALPTLFLARQSPDEKSDEKCNVLDLPQTR